MSEIFSSAVRIPTYSGELFGTVEYKNFENRSVAVLILADGGAIDRNGNSADGFNQSYCLRLLALELAKFGVASLRYDKRGIGLSEVPHAYTNELSFDDYVEDAVHCVHFLRQEMGFAKVIIAGHGEGALTGALAAQNSPVDGLVSIAGTAKNAALLLHEQLQRRLSGVELQQVDHILKQLHEGFFIDAVPERFEEIFSPAIQPYLMSLFRYDPVIELKKQKAPVLFLHGNRDLQVPYTDATALKSGNRNATLLFLEGMNHVLKQVDGNNDIQTEYYQNPLIPISKPLVVSMMSFVSKILRLRHSEDTELA